MIDTALKGISVSSVNMEDRKGLDIKAGDIVRVHQKIQDKEKTRIQIFEGLVLSRKHGTEAGATFTVRKVVDGIGVEKIYPLYSPQIDKIEIVRRSTMRRAKLYYIREKVAREIKRQMRRMRLMNLSSESGIEVKAEQDRKDAEEKVARVAEEARLAEATRIAEEEKAKNETAATNEAEATITDAEIVAPEAEKEEVK